MAVPESQLQTWSHQGSTAQSRDTYDTVRRVLDATGSPYRSKDFHIRLQGSYANDTNVFRDSDVDVLIRLDSTFYHDAHTLPPDQREIFERMYPGSAPYGLSQFKIEVAEWLREHFGTVNVGQKAIFVPGRNGRRDCDVLPCARFKYYYSVSSERESFADGICFLLRDGTRIVNFPEQHRTNCIAKHAETNQWFKPTVRLYKNMRNVLVDRRVLQDGIAPSYFIEGLLWNVPAHRFGASFGQTFVESLDYIVNQDRSSFMCANGIHRLLGNSLVNWSARDCAIFLEALRDMWRRWPNV